MVLGSFHRTMTTHTQDAVQRQCKGCHASFVTTFRDEFWTKKCQICCSSVVAYGPEIKSHVRKKHPFCPTCALGGEGALTQILGFRLPLMLTDLLASLKNLVVGTKVSDTDYYEDNDDSDVEDVCERLRKF